AELSDRGLRRERGGPGLYAQVVEGGAFPHQREDCFARRIAPAQGWLEGDQMIVRLAPALMLMAGAALARSGASPGPKTNGAGPDDNEVESEDGIPSSRLHWDKADPEQLEFMRRVYDRQVHLSRSAGGVFTPSLLESELEDIDHGNQARKPAGSF